MLCDTLHPLPAASGVDPQAANPSHRRQLLAKTHSTCPLFLLCRSRSCSQLACGGSLQRPVGHQHGCVHRSSSGPQRQVALPLWLVVRGPGGPGDHYFFLPLPGLCLPLPSNPGPPFHSGAPDTGGLGRTVYLSVTGLASCGKRALPRKQTPGSERFLMGTLHTGAGTRGGDAGGTTAVPDWVLLFLCQWDGQARWLRV